MQTKTTIMKGLSLAAASLLLASCSSMGDGGWTDMSGSFDGWDRVAQCTW